MGKAIKLALIEGGTVRKCRDQLTGGKDAYKCDDILGANASSKGLGVFEYQKRREF